MATPEFVAHLPPFDTRLVRLRPLLEGECVGEDEVRRPRGVLVHLVALRLRLPRQVCLVATHNVHHRTHERTHLSVLQPGIPGVS